MYNPNIYCYIANVNKINPKQRRFAKEYVKTGNVTQSAKNAGYSEQSAHVIGSRLLKKDTIQDEIKSVLDKAGLTDEYIAEGLKTAVEKGLSSERHTLSDGLRGIEMIAKLKDRFPAERKQIETKSLHLSLRGKSIEELEQEYQSLIEDAQRFNTKLIEH